MRDRSGHGLPRRYSGPLNWSLAVVMLVAALLLAACSDADLFGTTTTTRDPSSVPTSPIVTRVAINNFDFTPGDVTIQVGTTVEWQNRSEATSHTASPVDGAWDSGIILGGESFTHTFSAPGTFPYFCAIHPSMTGTITVQGG